MLVSRGNPKEQVICAFAQARLGNGGIIHQRFDKAFLFLLRAAIEGKGYLRGKNAETRHIDYSGELGYYVAADKALNPFLHRLLAYPDFFGNGAVRGSCIPVQFIKNLQVKIVN